MRTLEQALVAQAARAAAPAGEGPVHAVAQPDGRTRHDQRHDDILQRHHFIVGAALRDRGASHIALRQGAAVGEDCRAMPRPALG